MGYSRRRIPTTYNHSLTKSRKNYVREWLLSLLYHTKKSSANLSIKHQDLVALRDETSRCYSAELVRASDHLTQIGESGMAGDDQTNHNLQKIEGGLGLFAPSLQPLRRV